MSYKSQLSLNCDDFGISSKLDARCRGLTSVDGWQGQRGQTLALHLLLLESPFRLQDWVLKLGPSIYVAVRMKKGPILDFTLARCNLGALSAEIGSKNSGTTAAIA